MKPSYYEWDAGCYKHYAQTSWQTTLPELEHCAIESQWQILDLGCGDGRITAKLAEKVPNGKIVGMDRSANMIARALLNHHDIPQLSFQVMDNNSVYFGAIPEGADKRVGQFTMQEAILTMQDFVEKAYKMR